MTGPGHAVIALEAELLALRDTYRHLAHGGEPGLAAGDRAAMLAQLTREMREVKAGLKVLRGPHTPASASWLDDRVTPREQALAELIGEPRLELLEGSS